MMGRLTQITCDREGNLSATVFLESHFWGDVWRVDDVPYGKRQTDHWWFHCPTPQTIQLLRNIGFELPEENREPDFLAVKEFKPVTLTEEDIKKILDEDKQEISEDVDSTTPDGDSGESTSANPSPDIPRNSVVKRHAKASKAG